MRCRRRSPPAGRSAVSPSRATASASRSIGRACRIRRRCSRSAPTAAASAAGVAESRAVRRTPRSATTREFTVKGWGGDPVQVWVTYPPNFDPKKKWPLLHSIHGGPHAAHTDGWHYRWNTQVFAAPRLRRRRRQLSRLVGFRAEMAGNDHRRLRPPKEFADTEAATDFMLRRVTSIAIDWSRPAAATAATWSPT